MVLTDVTNTHHESLRIPEKPAVRRGSRKRVERLQHGVVVCCAGNTKQRRLRVAAGERISWRVQEVGHNSLGFHACFVASSLDVTASRTVLDVVELRRTDSHAGTFDADEAGELVLQFDNTYAWWTDKSLDICIRWTPIPARQLPV